MTQWELLEEVHAKLSRVESKADVLVSSLLDVIAVLRAMNAKLAASRGERDVVAEEGDDEDVW